MVAFTMKSFKDEFEIIFYFSTANICPEGKIVPPEMRHAINGNPIICVS